MFGTLTDLEIMPQNHRSNGAGQFGGAGGQFPAGNYRPNIQLPIHLSNQYFPSLYQASRANPLGQGNHSNSDPNIAYNGNRYQYPNQPVYLETGHQATGLEIPNIQVGETGGSYSELFLQSFTGGHGFEPIRMGDASNSRLEGNMDTTFNFRHETREDYAATGHVKVEEQSPQPDEREVLMTSPSPSPGDSEAAAEMGDSGGDEHIDYMASSDEEPLMKQSRRQKLSHTRLPESIIITQSPSPAPEPEILDHSDRAEMTARKKAPVVSDDGQDMYPLAPYASAVPANINDPLSFKLPTYEATYFISDDGYPSAKVSLPYMVREEILLCPDHSIQEFYLITQVFMPTHEVLANPDPEPRIALLNFHTIALMVIKAYDNFEEGDQLPGQLYRGQEFKDDSSRSIVRDARNADTDQIFFTAMDTWRIGNREMVRKNYGLIRGVQEFCDVALDIIYYIKEYGLLAAKERIRKERSDKGKKRGPRKVEQVAGTTKSSKEQKINELQPRKAVKQGDSKHTATKRTAPQAMNVSQPRKKFKATKAQGTSKARSQSRPNQKKKSLGISVIPNKRKK